MVYCDAPPTPYAAPPCFGVRPVPNPAAKPAPTNRRKHLSRCRSKTIGTPRGKHRAPRPRPLLHTETPPCHLAPSTVTLIATPSIADRTRGVSIGCGGRGEKRQRKADSRMQWTASGESAVGSWPSSPRKRGPRLVRVNLGPRFRGDDHVVRAVSCILPSAFCCLLPILSPFPRRTLDYTP